MRIQFRNGRWHALDLQTFRPKEAFKTLKEAVEAYPKASVEGWA